MAYQIVEIPVTLSNL